MPYFKKKQSIMPNEYLYSTTGNLFKTYTLSLSAVTDSSVTNSMANLVDSDTNYFVNKGWVMASITSGEENGKIGPYDSSASDGRQTTTNIIGLNDTFADLTDGDKDVGVLYVGTVNTALLYYEGTLGSPSTTVQDYLRTRNMDITFKT